MSEHHHPCFFSFVCVKPGVPFSTNIRDKAPGLSNAPGEWPTTTQAAAPPPPCAHVRAAADGNCEEIGVHARRDEDFAAVDDVAVAITAVATRPQSLHAPLWFHHPPVHASHVHSRGFDAGHIAAAGRFCDCEGRNALPC